MAILKISHFYSLDKEKESRYIETDMSMDEAANIVIGLQFFIEENTTYGSIGTVDENTAQEFLCQFFGCSPVTRQEWKLQGNKRSHTIDLYMERERRVGQCAEMCAHIEPYRDTPFMQTLMAFFENEENVGNDFA